MWRTQVMLIGGKVSRVRGTKVAAARACVRRWEKSFFFISRCFLQALHRYSQQQQKKSPSHVWVISSTWLALELLIRWGRKAADKGDAESSRIAPTHLTGGSPSPASLREKGDKTCVYPALSPPLPQHDARRSNKGARSGFSRRRRPPLIARTLSESPPGQQLALR